MAEPFRIGYTKDFLNAEGEVGWGDIALELLNGEPDLDFSYLPVDERVLTAENGGDFDALGVLAPRTTAELIDNSPRLTVVARFGVGYDTVDLDACTRNGVVVTNTPLGIRRAMSATGMTLILSLAHRVLDMHRVVGELGGWSRKMDYMGYQVTGKTLGTIGLGGIASDLFHLAEPWDMRRIAYDPYVSKEHAASINVSLVDFETVLRESDYLVVACNLTAETHHLLDAAALDKLKPTAFFVNIARGPIVDESALFEVLRGHRIRGAGLDVFEQEPVDPDNPILHLDNVIVAPHALGWTEESAWGIGKDVIQNILDIKHGKVPAFVVNREVLDTPKFQAKLAAYRERWGNA